MKGIYRVPHIQNHEVNTDYRDLEPPPITNFGNERFEPRNNEKLCQTKSLLNVKSTTTLYDQLRKVGYFRKEKLPTNQSQVKEKQKYLYLSLPELSERDIRRTRIPVHEYVLLELLEDGYEQSYQRLKYFIELDEKIRENIMKGRTVDPWEKQRKLLRYNDCMLRVLLSILKSSEEYHKQGEIEKEFTLLLLLAYEVENMENSWAWLAHELYSLASQISKGYKKDNGFGEAITNYLFGKFALLKMRDIDDAISCFVKTCDLSVGKSWTTLCITKNKTENIYLEASFMLHTALMEKADEVYHNNPYSSLELMKKALRKICETGRHPEIEEVLLELAEMYQKTDQYQRAIAILLRMVEQCKTLNDREDICNAYLLLARCYNSVKNPEKTLEFYEILLDIAKEWEIHEMAAAAHKYIGRFYLSKEGGFFTAEKHFSPAYKLFLEADIPEEADIMAVTIGRVRCLKYYPAFSKIVKYSSHRNAAHDALIRWKAGGLTFWKETVCKNGQTIFWLSYKFLPRKVLRKIQGELQLMDEKEKQEKADLGLIELEQKKRKHKKKKEKVLEEVVEEIKIEEEMQEVEESASEEIGDEDNEDEDESEEEMYEPQETAVVEIVEESESEESVIEADIVVEEDSLKKTNLVLEGQKYLCKFPPILPFNESMANAMNLEFGFKT